MMEATKILTVIAVISVVAAALGLFANLVILGPLSSVGKATTDTGTATLNVTQVAEIVFTKNLINWSVGQVNTSMVGCSSGPAILTAAFAAPSVACGTWQAQTGLTLENQGNSAVRLKLRSTNNATAGTTGPFIGSQTLTTLGSDSELVYNWRVANNESSSCVSGLGPGGFTSVNYTTAGTDQGTAICANLTAGAPSSGTPNSLNIEFNVTIPTDAIVGGKISQITAEAFVI